MINDEELYEELASVDNVNITWMTSAEIKDLRHEITLAMRKKDFKKAKVLNQTIIKSLDKTYDEIMKSDLEGVGDWLVDKVISWVPLCMEILTLSLTKLLFTPIATIGMTVVYIKELQSLIADVKATKHNKVLYTLVTGSGAKRAALTKISMMRDYAKSVDIMIDKRIVVEEELKKEGKYVKESTDTGELVEVYYENGSEPSYEDLLRQYQQTPIKLIAESVGSHRDIEPSVMEFLVTESAEYTDEVAYEMSLFGNLKGSIEHEFYKQDPALRSLVEEQAIIEAKLLANKKFGLFQEDVLALIRDRYHMEKQLRANVDEYTLEEAREYKRSLVKPLYAVVKEYVDELFYDESAQESMKETEV